MFETFKHLRKTFGKRSREVTLKYIRLDFFIKFYNLFLVNSKLITLESKQIS